MPLDVSITTPISDTLNLVSIEGEDGLSTTFSFRLELASSNASLDLNQALTKGIAITFSLPGGQSQIVHGIVTSFGQGAQSENGSTTYFARIEPWFALLRMNINQRIFQNQTVPDIITKVFSDLGLSDYKNSLTASYTARDYCVQYGATTFDFLSRLMESEGIFYFFTHTASHQTAGSGGEQWHLQGTSIGPAFRAGAKFALTGHFSPAANTAYVLRSVSHHLEVSTARYRNRFIAFPESVTFRPPRVTPQAIIRGAQTAIVVGKSGEEIWTDQYGRVKVKFHWDQSTAQDETSSCWIRVAQPWAGQQWGGFFLPRIGQEVIISFLDGNPDRPIITGSVYNGQQTTPYGLPDEQTKSDRKSVV